MWKKYKKTSNHFNPVTDNHSQPPAQNLKQRIRACESVQIPVLTRSVRNVKHRFSIVNLSIFSHTLTNVCHNKTPSDTAKIVLFDICILPQTPAMVFKPHALSLSLSRGDGGCLSFAPPHIQAHTISHGNMYSSTWLSVYVETGRRESQLHIATNTEIWKHFATWPTFRAVNCIVHLILTGWMETAVTGCCGSAIIPRSRRRRCRYLTRSTRTTTGGTNEWTDGFAWG